MTKKNKNSKKILKKILILVVSVCIISLAAITIINLYMIKSTEENIISIENTKDFKAECIIVLGAMVYSDGTPSPILKDRLDKGIELYNKGVASKLLMSGDNGEKEYNEVIHMRAYAIKKGIPKEDIYLDYAGFSTYESMYRLKEIFQVKRAVVVTQQYHLYRALYIGEHKGLELCGVPAADRLGGQKGRDIREVFARVKSFGLVLINADPTYMGDPVPLDTPQRITE